jgi:hypothetical protein
MAPFFWTITNSFASIARMTGSWATLSGECREDSRYNVRMLLIDRQVQAYVRVLLRLHRRISTPQEYYALVVRKAEVWDTHRRYTPPCPLQTHFPRPDPAGKNYIPSHHRAPIKIFTIFFFQSPPSLFSLASFFGGSYVDFLLFDTKCYLQKDSSLYGLKTIRYFYDKVAHRKIV